MLHYSCCMRETTKLNINKYQGVHLLKIRGKKRGNVQTIHTIPHSFNHFNPIYSHLPGDRISPPQDAVLRVQHRILLAVPDNKDNVVLSRLLVSSHQIGCLLGKGGSIISEMRKLSGAHIRVLSRDQIPKGVTENDEIVQKDGVERSSFAQAIHGSGVSPLGSERVPSAPWAPQCDGPSDGNEICLQTTTSAKAWDESRNINGIPVLRD
ncbi:KH domain-containing protein [Platanthera guangdongensis]|uniref:KH domain-containing protein n=1 Tax=Platanthera guangdongensis TaxID=2320717 RepID=A0ABR2M507_9ASPA